MKITCQSCQSKYTVSDEKVQGKTVKIKCRKCGATILVNSSGVTTGGGAPADAAPATSASYLVNVADGDQRTMTVPEIVAAYQTSVVTAETYVWADGMGDWQPLGQVDVIVTALNEPQQSAAIHELSADLEAPVAESAPAPMTAASAESAAAAPRGAARRDAGRRTQDLFGSGGAATEGVSPSGFPRNGSSSPVPARSPAGTKDENSVLFSLSALTAKVSVPPPSVSSRPSAPKDDSGIIDLKALARSAAAPPEAAPAPLAPSFVPEGGLFGPPAPSMSAPMPVTHELEAAPPPAKSKTALFLSLGAVATVLVIVGVFSWARGGGEKGTQAVASAAPTTTEAVTTTAAPVATETAAPQASAVASAAPSAAPDPKDPKITKRGPTGPVRVSGGGGAKTPTPPKPEPTKPDPPKKTGGCNCPAGDLMCAMKCSTK